MKTTIAKILAALLCLTLLCGAFVACGEKKNTTEGTPSTGSSQPAEEEKGIWLPFVENK